jgi:hypothetical protein
MRQVKHVCIYSGNRHTAKDRLQSSIAREELSQDVFALASGRRNRQAVGKRLAVVMEKEETDKR